MEGGLRSWAKTKLAACCGLFLCYDQRLFDVDSECSAQKHSYKYRADFH